MQPSLQTKRSGVLNGNDMASGGGSFYYGSLFLSSLCPYFGLPIDQLNFLACQLFAIGAASVFRKLLVPSATNAKARSSAEIIIGLLMTLFCFGHQVIHLVLLSTACYIVMVVTRSRALPAAVYIMALLHLSVLHIYRQIYDYAGYTMDVTGPMMILFQKVTSLAFALYDGAAADQSKLNVDQRSQAVRVVPTLRDYYGYCFCFHNILCGPHVFYRDFEDFIYGIQPPTSGSCAENADGRRRSTAASITAEKVITCLVSGASMMLLAPSFVTYVTGMEFVASSFLIKLLYLVLVLPLVRCKYYFAWTLGELVNMAAGLGFSGYDDEGNEKWDVIRSANIYGIELSTSVKDVINGWNIPTTVWLRRCVYDRAPAQFRTVAVFACSALWHGFYPGYYFTFGTAALILFAARHVRRVVRPHFQDSRPKRLLYDAVTSAFTRVASSYLATPFILYSYKATVAFYQSMYWWLHFAAIACILVLPHVGAAKTDAQPMPSNGLSVASVSSPLASFRHREGDDRQG